MTSPKRNAVPAGARQDIAPAPVQTTPPQIGMGHPEFHFVQSIMEMQKSLGEINASITALSKSVESTKTKVEDLVKWKNMILGGAVVVGVMLSGIVFVATKLSDYVEFKNPHAQPAAQTAAQPEPEEHTQLQQPRSLPTHKKP